MHFIDILILNYYFYNELNLLLIKIVFFSKWLTPKQIPYPLKKQAMKKLYFNKSNNFIFYILFLLIALLANITNAQTVTSPQVNFAQRTSTATPTKKIYNIKGDFTMLGNTNLTLVNYSNTTNNEGNAMKYVDIDSDSNTWNSSKASLELTNGGENSANPDCSTIIYAGLYWTGKSQDADTFTVSKQVQNGTQSINTNSTVTHGQNVTNTNYSLNISSINGGGSNNRYPSYTFTGNGKTYVFSYTNSSTVSLSVDGGTASNIPVTITTGTTNTATLNTPYTITDGTVTLTIKSLTRNPATASSTDYTVASSNYVSVNVTGTVPTYTTVNKNYDKKSISLKGPGATSTPQ